MHCTFCSKFSVSVTLTLYFDVLMLPENTCRFRAFLIHACNLKITLPTLFVDLESITLEDNIQVLLHCKT